MARIANRDARQYVQRREPFQGSNLYGVTTDSRYVVYSYGTHSPLLIWDGLWYENDDKYSRSTGRHLSQAHPRTQTQKLPTDEMKALAEKGFIEVATERMAA